MVKCSLREEKGCGWRVHAFKQKLIGSFYIREFNNVHNCGSVIRTSKHPRMNSQLVGDLMEDKVRRQPLYRSIDVISEVKDNYDLNIKYHHSWLGVDHARREIYGDHALSFNKLTSYFEEV